MARIVPDGSFSTPAVLQLQLTQYWSPGSLLNTFQTSNSVSVSVAVEQVTADAWFAPSGSDRPGGGKARLAHWVFPLLEAKSSVLAGVHVC